MTIRRTTFALALTAAALAGCSIANTTASEVALQYENGPLDSRTFYSCVPSGTREINDVSDDHYYYPSGQREFSFSQDAAADGPALSSATKDPTEITVSGTVKLSLNVDCTKFKDSSGREWPGGRLQMFHELIAAQRDAAPTDGGEQMKDGWKTILKNYVGAAIDRAVDNEALKYGYLDLYTSVERKAQWEKDVLGQIPNILKTLTQGEDLIRIDAVLLQKPTVSPAIVGGFAEKQAADLRAQAVEIDKRAAESFPGGIPAYQAYQQQQAVNQAIKDGKVQVLPVPYGSAIIAGK